MRRKRAIGYVIIIVAVIVVIASCWNHGDFNLFAKDNKKVVAAEIKNATDAVIDATKNASSSNQETGQETKNYLAITDEDITIIRKADYLGDNSFYDRYISSTESAKRTKYFSDAVSTEFEASSDEEKQKELEKEIWHNPVMGHAAALMFRDLGEINGVVIADENKWLTPFIDQYEQKGLSSFLMRDDKRNLYVTDDYQGVAVNLIALLEKFKRVGVEKIDTTWHYPLKGSDQSVKAYRNTDPNYVDREQSLDYTYIRKDGLVLVKFGFNLKDKRPEVFVNSGKPVEPTKPTNPTTPPTNPTTPPTQPTQPPTLKKDPYADPVHQGNANKGGGEGKGATKATPDADYTKAYSNDAKGGPDNSQGYSKPETVAPAAQPATETIVSTDQQQMDYSSNNNAVDSFGVGDEVVGADSSYEDFLD